MYISHMSKSLNLYYYWSNNMQCFFISDWGEWNPFTSSFKNCIKFD